MGGKCLSFNIVYQGKITSTQPFYNDKVYFGVAESRSKITPIPLTFYTSERHRTSKRIMGN